MIFLCEIILQVQKLTGSSNIVLKSLDLTSLQSVRELAKDINGKEKRLDILINNAGMDVEL